MVRLDSGRYATGELNDLYRRLIHRNNRLRRLLPLDPPERIVLNERRLLQQAVDAVLDNRHSPRPVPGRGGRPLRSLTDLLSGKHGRFRANLLGKRVDYSARAVIVVGPELKLHQCGLPRRIALALYEPFLVRRLLRGGLARTIGRARQMLADLARPGLLAQKGRLIVEELARERAVRHARRVLGQAGAGDPLAARNAQDILADYDTPAARRRSARILHELRPATALDEVRVALCEQGPAAARRRARALLVGRLWALLEEVTRGHPVLLNRAPTLHRPGIQAFEPVLVDGNALRLHPLVCKAFNADFDGDQMAIHLPLSVEARVEAAVLLLAPHNLLNPANGQPLVTPSQDIVLGCYYLTATLPGPAPREPAGAPVPAAGPLPPRAAPPAPADFTPPLTDQGEGAAFASPAEALLAHELGRVGVHARVTVRLPAGKAVVDEEHPAPGGFSPPRGRVVTTPGRVLFNALLPAALPYYNWTLTAGRLGRVVEDCHRRLGPRATVELLDRVKEAGFRAATRSGLSFATDDLPSPAVRSALLPATQRKADTLRAALRDGNITEDEYALNLLTLWTSAQKQVGAGLLHDMRQDRRGGRPYLNPLFAMADSGARGNVDQVRQLAGMRGLMASVSGRVVERPVLASLREGLPSWDYFVSAHGARKGLGDKGLRTADTGYLTRKLIDVAQHAVVRSDDCGTVRGVRKRVPEGEARTGLSLAALVRGRVCRQTVLDADGRAVVRENEVIGAAHAARLDALGVPEVQVRSPLTCEAAGGVCRRCYGLDLATERLAEEGLAVGVLAAQSIGEPGTQLMMRTFHVGGVAGKDIVNDLERITRLLEGSPLAGSLEELLEGEGPEAVQEFLIDEVRAVYRHHGLAIDDKHVEVIVAQLFRVRVVSVGETDLLPGDVLDRAAFRAANARLADPAASRATCRPHLLGLTRAAVQAGSFLAAASFQRTADVLTEAALAGRVDPLAGLKENVILGRLIPAGTGLRGRGEEGA
jgi:DNA-directed RNA polymerase beta' subunit